MLALLEEILQWVATILISHLPNVVLSARWNTQGEALLLEVVIVHNTRNTALRIIHSMVTPEEEVWIVVASIGVEAAVVVALPTFNVAAWKVLPVAACKVLPVEMLNLAAIKAVVAIQEPLKPLLQLTQLVEVWVL